MRYLWILALPALHLAANPAGMEVRHGEAAASSHAHELIVTQTSDQAILHWQDFSIQKGEVARFLQPSKDSAVLNRVLGPLPSSIHGLLQANGKVYLINPQGVLVGPEGKVETNSFVASSLNMADEEFLAHSAIHFQGDSEKAVVHLGTIEALEGEVFLIAREVENHGAIRATTVGLAGSSEVLLAPEGNQRIFISLQSTGKLENRGAINAVKAELRAAGGSAYALALNHSGIVEVDRSDIALYAESADVSGTLTSHGGAIRILGDRIRLIENCSIDASSSAGGGEILIGGDYLGQNPEVPTALVTYVGPNVSIRSEALRSGNGGKVIVWGEESCQFYGSADAKGGKTGGDGGFVEISSRNALDYRGKVSTLAPCGQTGTFLLDPSDITINGGATDNPFAPPYTYNPSGVASATLNYMDLQNALGSNNVTVATSNGTGGSGKITWTAGFPITWSSATTLTLTSDQAMSLNSDITNTGTGSFTAMNFTANSGGALAGTFDGITITGATLSSTQGAIVMNGSGGAGSSTNKNIGVIIQSGAVIQSTGTGAGAATISITGMGGINDTGNSNYGVNVDGSGTTMITSIDGDINITGGSGAITGSSTNYGIYISGGIIQSTGSSPGAKITFQGTGADAQATNYGVYIHGTPSLVTSATGAISLTGMGGAGAGNTNVGLVINGGGIVSSTGTGANAATITITGTATATTSNNNGVTFTGTGTTISSADGPITIIGTGSGTSGNNNIGIQISTNSAVTYGGSTPGTISLTGTGGNPAGSSNGVQISGSNGVTPSTSTPKDIYILGFGAAGGGTGIDIADNVGDTTLMTGNITLETDTIALAVMAGLPTILTAGDLLIQQHTPSTSIGLGGGSGTFSLSSAQLAAIGPGAAKLTIGRPNGSSIMQIKANTFKSNTSLILQDSEIDILTGTVTSTSGDITLIADTMSIGAALSSPGALTLEPMTVSSSIGLADGSAGSLMLSSSSLSHLSAATSITFGQALGTGTVDMAMYNYSPYGVPVIVNGATIGVSGPLTAATDMTLNIGLANAGTLNLSDTVTTSGTFLVNGGNNTNAFNIITTSAQTATLNGNSGLSTLTGPNTTNAWVITGSDNAGTLNTTISFSNILKLAGGTGTDTFTFNGAFRVGGVPGIDGGTGSNSITGPNLTTAWTITGNDGGRIDPSGSSGPTKFLNIQSLVGGTGDDTFTFNGAFQMTGATGIDGGMGSNEIQGPNGFNNWAVSSADGGTLTPMGAAATVFANIGNLFGGASGNTFTLNLGGTLSGEINGMGSSGNTLIYATNYGDVAIGLTSDVADGSATGITGGFFNIQTFTGSSSANNNFTGPGGTNNWTNTSLNTGTLNTAVSFSNFPNLTGGSGDDTFDFSSGSYISGVLDGGGGTNTLVGPNTAVNVWSITDNNQGSLGLINFINIENLLGGNRIDIFDFADQKGVAGYVDGGGGMNTLDYSLYTTPAQIYQITATSGEASNIGTGYFNIQNIIGNTNIHPIPSPPAPLVAASVVRQGVAQTQIVIIGTQNFLSLGTNWDSLSYGQYGSPLDGVFVLSEIERKIKTIGNGIR